MSCLFKNVNLVSFVLGEMCIGHFGQLRLGGLGARMLSHLAHHSYLSSCTSNLNSRNTESFHFSDSAIASFLKINSTEIPFVTGIEAMPVTSCKDDHNSVFPLMSKPAVMAPAEPPWAFCTAYSCFTVANAKLIRS